MSATAAGCDVAAAALPLRCHCRKLLMLLPLQHLVMLAHYGNSIGTDLLHAAKLRVNMDTAARTFTLMQRR